VTSSYFIVGGAGFIGSHFTDHLLGGTSTTRLTVFDNFSSGHEWHIDAHTSDSRFRVVRGDASDQSILTEAMAGHDTVIHLASNPDIARAATEPAIDFDQGTMLTHNVVEAARRNGVDLVLYASGSGVYGDIGETEADEDFGPLTPVSTYAASKLAGEALLSAYCSMFGVRGRAFRFANVVGARQTHGVGFDFIRKLRDDPQRLVILGDGQQSKSYIHIDDVIRAVMIAGERETRPYQVYNVATPDYITVTQIADIVIRSMGLEDGNVAIEYTGGRVGWRGDVPVVRLDASRIRDLGWECERSSVQAIEDSVRAML